MTLRCRIPLGRYWALLARYLRPRLGWVGALAVLLFCAVGLQLVSPQIMRRFIDGAGDTSVPLEELLVIALVFVGVALARQILDLSSTYAGRRLAWQATNELREDLTLHCLCLDMSFHNEHTPGQMIERIDGDVAGLASFLSRFVLLAIGNLTMLTGTLIVFTVEDWRLGVIMAVYAALTLLALSRQQQVALPYWLSARAAAADLFGFLAERLSGTVDIRALGAVPHVMRRLYHFTGQRLAREQKASLVNMRFGLILMGSYAIGQVLVVAAGYYLFGEAGVTLGTVAMLVYYLDLLHRPLTQLTQQMEEFEQAGASLGRVTELLQERSVIRTADPTSLPGGSLTLQLSGVCFAYGEDPVLEDLSFDVQAGRVLGLLGRTGSGKTTITRLLSRLYDPQQGFVRLGGVELTRLEPEALRSRISVVSQNAQLLSGTVRDSLTLFDPTHPDSTIMDVIRDVGMGAWFDGLPAGLDTRLEGDGGGLSAGQAQLLTLARAFLADPGLVILDEASSRLDPATEARIEHAVDRLLRGLTGIVIAHRLTTVQRVDDILILEDGRVEEWGSRAALASDPSSRFAGLLKTGLEGVLK
ncbi:MAG: helicase [Gemmatimonadaceae bacterium]|nr:helicase [Gemmatimonadaceae bacterium]